jgi:hypothetical protein
MHGGTIGDIGKSVSGEKERGLRRIKSRQMPAIRPEFSL